MAFDAVVVVAAVVVVEYDGGVEDNTGWRWWSLQRWFARHLKLLAWPWSYLGRRLHYYRWLIHSRYPYLYSLKLAEMIQFIDI